MRARDHVLVHSLTLAGSAHGGGTHAVGGRQRAGSRSGKSGSGGVTSTRSLRAKKGARLQMPHESSSAFHVHVDTACHSSISTFMLREGILIPAKNKKSGKGFFDFNI